MLARPSMAMVTRGYRLALGVLGLVVLLTTSPEPIHAGTCPSVRLCIAIDGSGSITSSQFSLMVNGLADAIVDPTVVPQSGAVEISAVQFGGSVAIAVSPTSITSQAAANSVASQLRAIVKDNGSTNMSGAVASCSSLITGSCGTSRQVINVVTDGEPDSQSATISARNAAIGAGVDEINAEAVAAPASAFDFLINQLVYPQPGIEAPPFTGPGFVIRTDSFDDFAVAVRGKIGTIVAQTCTIEPPSATNPLGTSHSFTVTVKNADGTPASGVVLDAEIVSGPHTGFGGSVTTGASGVVTFSYDETNGAGTDTIEVSGTLDGDDFSCTTTKIWAAPPPPCTVVPEMDTNPVNTEHTVTAIFEKGDGSPASGAPVSISITSGPNSPLLADGMANASGQLTFSYMGGPNPGTDVIEFAGVVDEQIARCSATKIWVSTPPSCTVVPPSATNLIGEEHEMTVTVLRGNGAPAVGITVTAQVTAGPHAGFTGTAQTSASGVVVASYTGTSAGTDTIRFSGIADAQAFSCTASKTWLAPPPPCTAVPASDTNTVGTQHSVLVTFEHGDGSPASGVDVSASIASGPNAPLLADLVTDASGQVSFVYTGGLDPGTDSLEFDAVVDGEPVSCSASKTWELPPPPPCTVNPVTDTNLVGTEHTVVATFRRANAFPAPGVDVSISIASGPNSPLLADGVTTSGGQVSFTYTGGPDAGTDVVQFSGFVDGHMVTCSATKTWELPPPPCTVNPASDTNPVGTEHTVVVTFRRGNSSPASGVDVSIGITAGPNFGLLADAQTNAAGQVVFSYEGSESAGTDVIEFSGFVDGHLVSCSASKTWRVPAPPCTVIPVESKNPVGSKHTVTAIFTKGDGSPASGVDVSIRVASGPNLPPLADGVDERGRSGRLVVHGGVRPPART